MKLLRYGASGQEKPGLLDASGAIRDLSGHVSDIGPAELSAESLARLAAIDPANLPKVEGAVRYGPCVGNVGKFIAIGLNFADHAAESGAPVPAEPIVFMKATTCIQGPNDEVMIPRDSVKTDWEVEMGCVIGKTARYVEESEALSYVAGYCTINDISEREFQLEKGSQWDKGKGCDTFGPLGPWLVTADEIPDPQDLHLWLELNGQRVQNGSTANMVFGCAELVSYISRFMTLLPGDVIVTGTPPGVGLGMKPQRFLKAGDTLRLGIDGLGVQEQVVVASR